MQLGTIIIHSIYGLGKVVKAKNNDVANIVFANGDEKTMLLTHPMMFVLSDQQIQIIRNYPTRQFGEEIKRRAKTYANLNTISQFKIKNDILSADVHGTSTYKITLNFKTKNLSCDCPYYDDCKHEYAFIDLLNKGLAFLETVDENAYMNKSNNASSNHDPLAIAEFELTPLIEAYTKDFLNKKNIIALYKYLHCRRYSNTAVLAYLNVIKMAKIEDAFIQEGLLLIAYIANKDSNNLYHVLNNEKVFTQFDPYKYLKNAMYAFEDCKYDGIYHYCYIHGVLKDFSNFFLSLIDSFEVVDNNEFLKCNLPNIIRNYSDDVDEKYVAKAAFFTNDPGLIDISAKYLKDPIFNSRKAYIKLEKYGKSMMPLYYRFFTKEQLLILLPFLSSTKEAQKEFIDKSTDLDKTQYITLFATLIQCINHEKHKLLYGPLIEAFPHRTFVNYVFERIYNGSTPSREMKLFDDDFNLLDFEESLPNNVELDDIDFYSEFVIETTHEYKDCTLEFKWLLKGSSLPLIECVYHTNNNDVREFNILDKDDDTTNIYYMFSRCVNNPIFETKLFEFKKIAAEQNFKQKYKKYLDQFDDIEKNIFHSFVTNHHNKINIEYTLLFETSRFDNNVSCSIRIGYDKMYKITNISAFLDKYYYEEEKFYGSQLTYTHSYETLKPKDKKIISLLQNINKASRYYRANSFLDLGTNDSCTLLEYLKGETVVVKDENYVVDENEFEFKAFVDEKLVLSNNLPTKSKIYAIGYNVYLKNDEKRTIQTIRDGKALMPLIDLVKGGKTMALKEILPYFINKVYVFYKQNIILDPSVLPKFDDLPFKIKSYFDIDDKNIIKVKSAYIKNDIEIQLDDVSDLHDQLLVSQYERLLVDMGFVDGKIDDEDSFINFFDYDFTTFSKVSEIYLSDSLQNKQITSFNPPSLRMDYENNMFTVFSDESSYTEEELQAILNALKKKKKYVQLTGGKIINITDKKVHDYYELINELSLDQSHLLTAQTKPLYYSLIAFSSLNKIEMNEKLSEMVKDIANFKSKDVAVPSLDIRLKNYQQEGYKWLTTLCDYYLSGVLADDMGLGKTAQIIALFAGYKVQHPSLVVAPKSLVFNWYSEIQRFCPSLTPIMIYGSKNERKTILDNILSDANTIYLTSYDSLKLDLEFYKDKQFSFLVLDEAQYIKNINAKKTMSVKQINADHRFALTGTPIENNLFDLYSLFDFLMPNYLPSLTKFKENITDESFQNLIAKRVAPFILRRTKKEVLKELPDKFIRIITSPMEQEQKKLYDAHVYNAKQILENGGKSFDVLYLLTRLRQICVDPHTFIDNYNGESCKINALMELIPTYIDNNHRILVFSQFVSALEIVEKELQQANIKYLKITGDTAAKKRIDQVNEFNNNAKYKVFLISLKAGGNGLNLVGADTVIHLDPWWNLAAENQATDRAYRIGQTKNVEVIKLIAENSIEQRVIELQNKKKDLFDKLISENDSSITSITLDDMKFILE